MQSHFKRQAYSHMQELFLYDDRHYVISTCFGYQAVKTNQVVTLEASIWNR